MLITLIKTTHPLTCWVQPCKICWRLKGAGERLDLVVLGAGLFVPAAGAVELGWLCLSTRLSREVPERRRQALEFRFDIRPVDSAQNWCAVPVVHFDFHFYDSCCCLEVISSVAMLSIIKFCVSLFDLSLFRLTYLYVGAKFCLGAADWNRL